MQIKTTSQAPLSICKPKRTLFKNNFKRYLMERTLECCWENNVIEYKFLQKISCNFKFHLRTCLQQTISGASNLSPSRAFYVSVVLCCKLSLPNRNNLLSFQYQASSQDQGVKFAGKCYVNCHLPTVSGQHLVFFPFLRTNFTFRLRILIQLR